MLSNTVDCGPLSDPTNGQVVINGTTLGEIANYTCDSKYTLIGNSSRVCKDDGAWSGLSCNVSMYVPSSKNHFA